MIRKLVALLPIPGCAAAITGGFLVHPAAGCGIAALTCFVLEWRYDRD